ncbi:shikimate dehydrogenase [Clostridium sp. MCC353]|uniref:shikimate dehydrogenase n=1 Tax=Clostridium sp. MCC353 TaxID=2592646 RepID=UPI00207A8A6E|nr:shikimate dehydrogenase [Clostridium sp. MCC353]MBT9776301.1 shikimate dehydrogenase [Clostridium sp. MCC353]
MINGKTKVCGVIANPVEHSMSPAMQNLYAERTGVDFAYLPFRVEEKELEAAVKGAYALNLVGLNVTVPHKQAVMKYLSEIDEDAAAIGAVNTLVRMEGGFKGYNTDAAGLLRAMKKAGISVNGEECILIGAGGAAKAAAYLLAKEGASVIYVLNRSVERAVELAGYINGLNGRKVMIPLAITDYNKIPAGSYVAVQSTSVGMYPNVDGAPVEDEAFYKKIHTGIDIVYTPMETKFMKYVKAAGGKAVNGLDMLLYQGIIAYELWNPDAPVDEDTACEAKKLMMNLLRQN